MVVEGEDFHNDEPHGNGKHEDMMALEIEGPNRNGISVNNDSSKYYHDSSHGDDATTTTTTTTTAIMSNSETAQITVNIIISFVGAGLLGIPHAFARAGWFLGSISLCTISALNVYAMLLLPKVKRRIQRERGIVCHSYGTLGRVLLGQSGEVLVNICLLISQAGFATAYLIFIAESLTSRGVARWKICFGCVPGLALLVQARDMKHLSPFSLLANLANLLGLSAVLVQDVETLEEPYDEREQVDNEIHAMKWKGALYVMAVTLYSMEGVGLVLSLESSCSDRSKFPNLLTKVVGGITLFMAFFGIAGYWAFGDETLAPITLNLGHSKAATLVQGALCVALYFTYPIMMFPVWTIAEERILKLSSSTPNTITGEVYQPAGTDDIDPSDEGTDTGIHMDTIINPMNDEDEDDVVIYGYDDEDGDDDDDETRGDGDDDEASHVHHAPPQSVTHVWQRRILRSSIVLGTAVIAYAVPDFGEYLSLVGSSICTILGFLLPFYFHLLLYGPELKRMEYGLNVFLLFGGGLFALVGTVQSVSHMVAG